jgi:hypothetical protein
MENQFNVITNDDLEGLASRLLAKYQEMQPPVKEPMPQRVGTIEARKIVAKVWGYEPSQSLWTKLSMKKLIPIEGVAGRSIVYSPEKLIEWAQSQITKPEDIVLRSVTNAARKRGRPKAEAQNG